MTATLDESDTRNDQHLETETEAETKRVQLERMDDHPR